MDHTSIVAETKKLRQHVKVLSRQRDLRFHEMKRCCRAAYDALVKNTQLKIDESLVDHIQNKEFTVFLEKMHKALDCDPFIKKGPIYALILESWSCLYDIAKLHCTQQKKEIDLLCKRKSVDEITLLYQRDILKKLEAEMAVMNVKFASCRVLNLVEQGVYRPPKNAKEYRGKAYKSFLALAQDTKMIKITKHDLGHEELKKILPTENPNQVEVSTGAQPLHHASMKGKAEEVKLLLNVKANVNAQTLRGFTPLHFAYRFGHDECVNILLENGANV